MKITAESRPRSCPPAQQTGPCAGAIRLALAIGCLCAALVGCERRGVETTEVPKGIERVPEETQTVERPADEDDRAATTSDAEPWATPEGWTRDAEPRPMRLATYMAPDADGPVEVAISRFPGRVGGELANINRWRGQMGLPPVDATGLEGVITRFDAPGYDGYETRIDSPQGTMLAAGVYDESADQTWFVRTTTTDAAADRLQDTVFGVARSIAGLDG